MVRLFVPSKSILRQSQPEYGGPDRCGGSKRRQSNPFELTQRRCYRERVEDVLRTDDDATGTSFTLAEEGWARQRFRGLKTTGGTIRRSQRKSTALYVVVHHAPSGVPADAGGFDVALTEWETPRATLGDPGQPPERRSQASDPSRHGSECS